MAVALTFAATSSATSSGSVATFTGLGIGTAAADRIVLVCVTMQLDATFTGCTIGGVAANKLQEVYNTTASPDIGAAIFALHVPSGTTANITVTLSAGNGVVGISTIAMTGSALMPGTANLQDSDELTGSGVDITITGLFIPTSGGGVCIWANDTQGTAVTWTGMSEVSDASYTTHRHSAATSITSGLTNRVADGATAEQALLGVSFRQGVILQPALTTNTPTIYSPAVTTVIAPFVTNVQSFYTPEVLRPLFTWPAVLPQCPLDVYFVQDPIHNVVRTEMDSGRARHRRRFPQVFSKVSLSWAMTTLQLRQFKNAMRRNIGPDWFYIDLPLDGPPRTVEARFTPKDKVTIRYSPPTLWLVEAIIEINDQPQPRVIPNVYGDQLGAIGEFPMGQGSVGGVGGTADFGLFWPDVLPCPLVEGYTQEPEFGLRRSELEIGEARQDSRNQILSRVSLAWVFTDDELIIFRQWLEYTIKATSFFRITLKLDFDMTVRARFVITEPPTITYVAPDTWNVTAILEVDDRSFVEPGSVQDLYGAGLGTLGELAIGQGTPDYA